VRSFNRVIEVGLDREVPETHDSIAWGVDRVNEAGPIDLLIGPAFFNLRRRCQRKAWGVAPRSAKQSLSSPRSGRQPFAKIAY
jgi:hypothetical protein